MLPIRDNVPTRTFPAVTIGLILARLYQRASKDRAFVRTGLGGQKVVMDGGAVCLPVFHELIWVNMNTLKLEVHRSGADSLFTKDRMRVDELKLDDATGSGPVLSNMKLPVP